MQKTPPLLADAHQDLITDIEGCRYRGAHDVGEVEERVRARKKVANSGSLKLAKLEGHKPDVSSFE